MALTNTELRYYDSNVLRLPADKRKEYYSQVDDRLITELSRSVREKTEIKITKVVKAGSVPIAPCAAPQGGGRSCRCVGGCVGGFWQPAEAPWSGLIA